MMCSRTAPIVTTESTSSCRCTQGADELGYGAYIMQEGLENPIYIVYRFYLGHHLSRSMFGIC